MEGREVQQVLETRKSYTIMYYRKQEGKWEEKKLNKNKRFSKLLKIIIIEI